LINRFGGARAAVEALPDLSRRGGLKRPIRIYPREAAERDFENADRHGARFIALGESLYPPFLRHISDAPPLICAVGLLELLTSFCIGIVGARNASAVGRKFARQLASELGAADYTIISGLARGIDTAAHEASISTGTIAVMSGGIDVIYPPENRELFEAISQQGVVLTEMTPGTKPKAEYFPRRNRIISGCSVGVIVLEAALRSGSLITARMAGEQGREVLAVPGSPMDPRAAGTNKLIKDGATLVRNTSDVLEAVNTLAARDMILRQEMDQPGDVTGGPEEETDVQTSDRQRVLTLLGPAPIDVDDIIRESGLKAQTVITVIIELDLAGRIEWDSASRVSLRL
jgi:DNA processing protein